jgi:transcriptional regulator GlxA family with amidase domain
MILVQNEYQPQEERDETEEWIKTVARETEVAMSVCNGAYLLARAGLLNDKRVTTHWTAMSGLKREAPTAMALENVRYVDNGRVLTTAGVSAGIDGALHIVDRLLGRLAARLTARYMEYDWKPVKKLRSPSSFLHLLKIADGLAAY